MLPRNRIVHAAREDRTAYGMYVKTASPDVVELAGAGGLDFVRFDLLHGPITVAQLADLVRAAFSVGITPTVRIPKLPVVIDSVLELGVMGITFPDVRDAEEAVELVQLTRPVPVGRRHGPRPNRFGSVGATDYARWSHEELLVSVQLESAAGVQAAADIAGTPGVDMIHCGRSDLAAALGAASADDAAVREAEVAVVQHARAAGKIVGFHVPPGAAVVERDREWERLGARCVTMGGDTQILLAAIRDRRSLLAG